MMTLAVLLSLLVLGSAVVIPEPENTTEFIQAVFGAIHAGNYRYLAAMAIILVVFLVRKYGAKKLPFLANGKWAWAAAVLLGSLGALAANLTSDSPPKTFMAIVATLAAGAFTGAGAAGIVKGSTEWLGKKPPAA